jgi:transcriptional regulator with XRE-family HTH domain
MLFKDKLKAMRDAAGLTQEQLAERSGVPLGSIRGYEQGQRSKPSLPVAVKLARALGTVCDSFAACEDIGGADVEKPRGKGKRK